ncbi:hypothetical protein Btru_074606 [Bulinus truncatus]|nr:hypothetical protein Btru_074606 [Bulinus truncatus]
MKCKNLGFFYSFQSCYIDKMPSVNLECNPRLPTVNLECNPRLPTVDPECNPRLPTVDPECNPRLPTVDPECNPRLPTIDPECNPRLPTVDPECNPRLPTVDPECCRHLPYDAGSGLMLRKKCETHETHSRNTIVIKMASSTRMKLDIINQLPVLSTTIYFSRKRVIRFVSIRLKSKYFFSLSTKTYLLYFLLLYCATCMLLFTRMRYVAAYLLAVLGGKASPSSADIEKILSSVGIEAESDKINKIISELKGKNLEEVITAGSSKLASVPSGGAVAAAPAGGAPAKGGAAPAAAPAADKKEDKKKEESEESEDDMGFGLFD